VKRINCRLVPHVMDGMMYPKNAQKILNNKSSVSKKKFESALDCILCIHKQDTNDEIGTSDIFKMRHSHSMTFETLSTLYKADFLSIVIPMIEKKLSPNAHWSEQECAILAIGALAEGCNKEMRDYIPKYFPILLEGLSSKNVWQYL
jgi:hypothetical protein